MGLGWCLRSGLVVFGMLAGLGPAAEVVRLFRARELARNFTTFGRLPEIPITAFDHATLALALVLICAACLEVVGLRIAAPVAFLASVGLWVYYGPAVWDKITGDMRFEMAVGHTIPFSWRMFAYEVAATTWAGALTYLRRHDHR